MSAGTSTAGAGTDSARGGRFRRLYYGQTKFDFVRRRRIWFAISGVIILAGVISLATRGLNYDIEFVGGTSWTVADTNGVGVTQAQAAVGAVGLSHATITTLGSGSHTQLDVEAKVSSSAGAVSTALQNKVTDALAHLTHTSPSAVSVEAVGPTWGSQVTHKAVEALIVFLIMISAYISIFFEWKMALAAIVAVAHDILVTVGIYSLTFFLVTPDTVVAFLTVLGYSLYDTIVVFDRIRDNTKGLGATGKLSFSDVVNLSMNQTLARSINTSLVAILPILAVLILGADILGATTLQYFGLALLIGLTSGAYSSIFIASPLLAMLKEHEPRYVEIRRRLEARNSAVQLLTPAFAAAGFLDDGERGTSRRQKKGRAPVPSGPIRPRGAGRPSVPEPLPADMGASYEELEDVQEAAAGAALRPAGAARGDGNRPRQQANRPSGSGRPARPSGGGQQNRPAPRPRKKK
ncbi:MAG TPA: protein translocase subunit SecF, partial [Acidimicrobiales bacterium]|nr:protein translocase subunit SecF [Acidimicrobiales bacterium]